MKLTANLLALLLVPSLLMAGSYQEIQIPWQTETTIFEDMPDLELMKKRDGEWMRLLSRPELTQELMNRGIPVTIRIDDLEAHYANTAKLGPNFGQFYTYSETVDFLDSLHAAHPSITTDKDSIGTTLEGNTIWAMKISDNPNSDEAEPEVLFDALHHARETITVSVVLNFMRHLCANYGTDAQATFLVENREIWFVPIVNPDGYLYNEAQNPNGGGLWRKNRNPNGGGCVGVDLNRNYDIDFGGAGASSNPCDETYHGPSAFSELETQAMRDFIDAHEFVTHNSYHSVVGATLYPWGWTTSAPPDLATFQSVADGMNEFNGYTSGNVFDILAYLASGGMLDWSYGDTTNHSEVIAFTTEVGGTGFWPNESEIPQLLSEMLYPDIYLSLVAGSYVTANASAIAGGNGNAQLDAGETVDLTLTLENQGILIDANTVSVTVTSNDSYVEILDATSSYGSIVAGGSVSNGGDPFSLAVDAATPDGHAVELNVTTTWDNAGLNVETITLVVGALPSIVADDFESGGAGWTSVPFAGTGEWVLIDPNGTTYQAGDDATPAPGVTAWITAQNTALGVDDVDGGTAALRSPNFAVGPAANVRLAFQYFFGQRDQGDDSGDFFSIDLSTDGGASFPTNLVSIGDVTSLPTWETYDTDLDSLLGGVPANVMLRIRAADGTGGGDIVEGGFDELYLLDDGTGNNPPATPALASPANGATGVPQNVTLVVDNAIDPEANPLTYGFRVYDDSLLTNLVRSVNGVAEGVSQTNWTVTPLLPAGQYWWRAFAEDAEERSPFAAAKSFDTDISTGVGDTRPVDVISFAPARPNPFAGNTTIRFALPSQMQVRADVFDMTGRRVQSLYRGLLPAGRQVLAWDGRTSAGHEAAAGLYFVRLTAGEQKRNFKVTLVR
ncbi:MAG: T9SS type A sorting domain-containing protein [Gemmatimonadetes bacterium]|nr:T9SS type A sorting domain-containing protein [Gemmatimonadota bacterium]